MMGLLGHSTAPPEQVGWRPRRLNASLSILVMALVAATASCVIMALDTAGGHVATAASVRLSSAGGG